MSRSEPKEEEQAESESLYQRRSRGAASAVAGLVMTLAVLVLVGWACNIEVLRSVIPGLTAMNPGGTAIAFLLAGGSLWGLSTKSCRTRIGPVAWACAATVVTLTTLRLGLYLFGLEWGPDQWLFPMKLDLYQPPNRMAPNTALGLLMAGIALLATDVETRSGHRPTQWLAVAAGLLSLFTLIGYLYNATVLIGLQAHIPMALNSAGMLALLAMGLLLVRPHRGIMAVLSRTEIGSVMARRLLPASILAPTVFACLASAGPRAGLMEPAFGISLFVISTTILFTTLIWWNAKSLNRIDLERSQTQKELARKSAILTSVLNSMGDGVVVADRDGRFLIFNPVAERILGLGATDASPEEWSSQYGLFSAETGMPLESGKIPLVRAIRGESTDQEDLLIRSTARSEDVHISVTGRPLKGDEGVEGGVVVFQDTTQRRRAAEALRVARDDADAANLAKSEFLANMSHEIRTPMNAVIGMTQLVLESELGEEQRAYLKIANDSAESLLSLINDILDFSKIEAGKLELDHTPFLLREVLGDAMKTLAVRARGKDLELACHVAEGVPDALVGDPHRLRQVVTNLVGNALKFTERGEVVLDVTPEELTEGRVRFHVAVRDTGIGIPHDKLHLLFGVFSQVDASTTRRFGGTGLGLAITARLVPLMHGRTWVDSTPGQGSTFHFTAEFQRDPSPQKGRGTFEALSGLRVLIVDDNATNRLILMEMLTAGRMRASSVDSAEAALDELRQADSLGDPYRLVLSDVQMPDVDGFEFMSRIRQDKSFGSTVILMFSSGSGPGDMARARELGAASYLMKPIKASELLATMEAAIVRSAVPEDVKESNEVQAASLKILLAEDSEANRKLAAGVLGKWGHSLTIVNNGVEALAAFEKGSYDVILMDVQMPEMDGLEATARIRILEKKRGGHVPIVAMTAHAMKGDREQCLNGGMDDYISKPIRWPDLREVFARITPVNERPDDPVEKSRPAIASSALNGVALDYVPNQNLGPAAVIPTPRQDALNWNEALRAVAGDPGLLLEVLNSLLTEWPAILVEIDRSVAAGDTVSLRRAAHTIRGSLRFFGRTTASDNAAQLESLAQSGEMSAFSMLLPTFHLDIQGIVESVKERRDAMASNAG